MIAFEQKLVELESLRGTHYFLALLLLELSWKKRQNHLQTIENINLSKLYTCKFCHPPQTKENTYLIFLTHAKTPNACFYTDDLKLVEQLLEDRGFIM